MNKKIGILMFFILLLLLPSAFSKSYIGEEYEINQNEVYFFYSVTCPHCQAEMEFLESLEKECTDVKINYILAAKNEEMFEYFAFKYNASTAGVPRTFVGDKAFVGFSPEDGPLEMSQVHKAYIGYENQLSHAIFSLSQDHDQLCIEENITDIAKMDFSHYAIFIVLLCYALSFFFFRTKFKSKPKIKKYWMSIFVLILIICMFIFIKSFSEVAIKNFATSLPFPVFVFIVALADGFNPCAFTVLIILLSLLTYTKRKRDMMTLGLTFIITSAVMYFIFIFAMIFIGSWAMEKYSSIILLVLGIGITIAGLVNIKDFFFLNKGPSLSLSNDDKLKFTKKARNIINQLKESNDAKTFILAILGTITLAIFVNLVELGCTAILPTIYMASLLQSYGNTLNVNHVIWTLFYSAIYILPLLAILMNFIYSFKSSRLSESQGRKLKLFSGVMMILFGLIMIFMPNILIFN